VVEAETVDEAEAVVAEAGGVAASTGRTIKGSSSPMPCISGGTI
jgi:hypothetical protein